MSATGRAAPHRRAARIKSKFRETPKSSSRDLKKASHTSAGGMKSPGNVTKEEFVHIPAEIFLIGGLAVLALVFIMSMFAQMYRKAGPHQALVVYGFRRTRIIKGGGTFIWPMFENYRELTLQLMSFDVAPQQDLYTMQGVAVTVE